MSKILLMIFSVMILSLSMTVNSTYASSVCPENTEWDGNACTNKEPIKKSSKKKNKPVQETIVIPPVNENLKNNMINIEVEKTRELKLKQKIKQDEVLPTMITRNNHYFEGIKNWNAKIAEIYLQNMLNGKSIQNPNFGKNMYKQIEYKERFSRSEDNILQNQIILEKNIAEQTFLKLWGNITNH